MGTVAEERNAELRKFSEARITRSALLISEIVHDLHRYGDIPCLSELAVPVLAPAIEAHLANRGSICPSKRSQSQYHLQSCIQVLQQLQEMHPSADASYRRLQDSLGQDALGLFSIPSQPSPIAVQVEGGELQTRNGHPCGLQSHDPSSQGADAVSLAFSKPAAAAAYILDRATTTDWEKKLIASLADATGTRATVTYSPETNDVWSRPISGARLRGSTSHLPCSNLDFTMNSVPPDYRVYPPSTSPLDYSVDGGPQSWTWEVWCQRLGTMMCDSEAQLRSILDPVLPLETGVTTTSQDM
ncbi:hypothetical protein BJX66DRAFT_319823 [Aspergillus keveii]|uniref:Uncharacterized protein n=1 Tax=Aspergillus keveii TaxID=714993 RepID=A0ABR4FHS0_9EURO